IVVPEEIEATVRLFSHVLGSYFVPQETVAKYVQEIRADDYEIIRGSIQEAHLMVLKGLDEEGLHTRVVAVREDSPAAGQTLKDLKLRKKYGITVLTVRRGDETIGNPGASLKLESSDRLLLMASANQFEQSATLFRSDG